MAIARQSQSKDRFSTSMFWLHPQPQHRVVLRDADAERAPSRIAPIAPVEDDTVMRGAASPAVHRDFGGHVVCIPADDLEAVAAIRATGDLARFVPHAARLGVVSGVTACGPAPIRGPTVGVALAAWRVSFEIGDMQCGDGAEARRYGDRRQAVLRTVVEDQIGEPVGSRIGRCSAECEHRTAHRRWPRDAARLLSRRCRPRCRHAWPGTMTVPESRRGARRGMRRWSRMRNAVRRSRSGGGAGYAVPIATPTFTPTRRGSMRTRSG